MREWIRTVDRLPDKSGYYLCANDGRIYCLAFSWKNKLFNSFDEFQLEDAKQFAIPVTHWMPTPEPPKED